MGFETLRYAEKHNKKMNMSKPHLRLTITGFRSGKVVSAREFLVLFATF